MTQDSMPMICDSSNRRQGGSLFSFALPVQVLLVALLLNLLPVSNVLAIQFEIWQTGISRQEMMVIAQENDLPLAKDGYLHAGESFDPRLVEGSDDRYYYLTTLLEQPAKVRLFLTSPRPGVEQRLYEIETSWNDPAKHRPLLHALVSRMDSQYGRGRTAKNSFQKSLTWNPEPGQEILLLLTPTMLQVTYTDLKIRP